MKKSASAKTVKADMEMDAKKGIKESSKRDLKIDASKGIKESDEKKFLKKRK